MNISKSRMEEALDYLASTDEDYARAKTLYDGLCEQRKTVKAKNFILSRAAAQTAKEHDAYNSHEYVQHLYKMEVAELEYLTLQAKRYTENTVIDCWRSLNAARNKGQII